MTAPVRSPVFPPLQFATPIAVYRIFGYVDSQQWEVIEYGLRRSLIGARVTATSLMQTLGELLWYADVFYAMGAAALMCVRLVCLMRKRKGTVGAGPLEPGR